MIMSKENYEKAKELNTHICKDCGKVFINFKGIHQHVNKFGHHQFQLQGSDLCLMVG